jgi:hypothetical protein
MLSTQGSALSEGLKTLKEDLTFAEDLVLVRCDPPAVHATLFVPYM